MIRKRGDLGPFGGAAPPELPAESSAEPEPWEAGRGLRRLAFVTLWATGPDPRRDHVFRIQAIRRDEDGGTESFDRWCEHPFREGGVDAEEGSARASRRMAREFGVTSSDLVDAGDARAAWCELETFLEQRVAVVTDRTSFEMWARELGGEGAGAGARLDLVGLASLLAPGRLAAAGDRIPARLLAPDPELERRPQAIGPAHLLAALGQLVGRALEADEATLALLALGYREIWETLRRTDSEAAAEVALVLRLLEHPSQWRDGAGELFPPHPALTDGRLSDARRAFDSIEGAVDHALPPWALSRVAERMREEKAAPAIAAGLEEERELSRADRRLIDEIFQEHLPRYFAERGEEGGGYRAGQHQVAAEAAGFLGKRELLLMHAPTGTGKTLAYLVPALLWAQREQVRIGVATFTRALQEQAMDRDVPIARELLRRAGVASDEVQLRVSVLKGRSNYLCWRALRLQSPMRGQPAVDTLAWLSLALFALGDPDGDLDRLSAQRPLSWLDERAWQRALEQTLRLVRAESGCCSRPNDRAACGADAARRRAEHSHLVITNHAFALARRELFRHLIFDECEHLHDVAHSAYSHFIGMRELRDLLGRFHRADGRRPGPLDKVADAALKGSPAWSSVHECLEACEIANASLARLGDAVHDYKLWREEEAGARKDSETHSLFREFVIDRDSDDLLSSHRLLAGALNELSAGTARLAEHLETLPARGVPRLRRRLSILRSELEEALTATEAWIPRADAGEPRFGTETFHDLEARPGFGDYLAARALLPHEFLGRRYYPELFGALFLSATTWLKGGFDSAATYLGLERAAHPAEDEDRAPCPVRTFRAPEVFDYGRVLVCAPRDAPPVHRDKRGFLNYVARFTGYLAERTRGRVLVLFTNADDCKSTGRLLEPFFAAHHLPFWYQRMRGSTKEELGERFRARIDSVLLGLDTFWYGADFPGPTLEYLVLVRLPYGVPDRYHHAQCAAIGSGDQRRQIYLPRALAKFRQGFGRLMRKETDRGCVFFLDGRVIEPRHRMFLRELPLADSFESALDDGITEGKARLVRGDTDHCVHEALAHMGMLADVERRGLDRSFEGWRLRVEKWRETGASAIDEGEIPF